MIIITNGMDIFDGAKKPKCFISDERSDHDYDVRQP